MRDLTGLITSAEAARIAGVGATAIKRWADSGALPCVRTAGGHRRFRMSDVLSLIAGEPSGSGRWDEWVAMLTTDGNRYRIESRLLELRASLGAWHLVAEHLAELLVEIGERWHAGRLSVIEEHVASSALQRACGAVSDTVAMPVSAPRCLLASAEGDDHTLGLSLVELCLAEAGWRGEWAGRATRTTDVIERVRGGGLKMVALSASSVSVEQATLESAQRAIGSACRDAGVLLAFGGEGAWSTQVPFGRRFTTLSDFSRFAVARRMSV